MNLPNLSDEMSKILLNNDSKFNGTQHRCTLKGGLSGRMTWQFLITLELFSP